MESHKEKPGQVGLPGRVILGLEIAADSSGCLSDRPEPVNPAETIALFAERWPNCFAVYQKNRRPLKLGIHEEVITALADVVAVGDILAALRIYTGNKIYLRECRAGKDRIGLDGAPCGVVTEQEQAYAARKIAALPKPPPPRRVEPAVRKVHPANAGKPMLTLRGRSIEQVRS